jgi:ferredoxin-NADP reductase
MDRSKEVGVFVVITFLLLLVTYIVRGNSFNSIFHILQLALVKSSFFFFAFVMFTEPLTSPTTKRLQIGFAVATSLLYTTPQIHPFGIVLTPEMALCFANIFSYIYSPKYKFTLTIKEIRKIAQNSFELIFPRPREFAFEAGQFMEWTLPHPHPDSRGNRRYFSLASSPKENDLAIAIRYYEPPSSFKKNLVNFKPGQTIQASELSGDFTLPKDKRQKLVFIAGGIGIVPFRSMIRDLIERNDKRDIVLFYANKTMAEIAYSEDFKEAQSAFGLKTIYALDNPPANWPGHSGFIDNKLIVQSVPDYKERTFYISGPPKMVDAFKSILSQMGIAKKNIKTDYFPGY